MKYVNILNMFKHNSYEICIELNNCNLNKRKVLQNKVFLFNLIQTVEFENELISIVVSFVFSLLKIFEVFL